MYKKYNELINKTNRFIRSFNKEPINVAFAAKGIGQSVIDSGQAKVDAMSSHVGLREVVDTNARKAIGNRTAYLRIMQRECSSFELALAKVFRTEQEKRKYGFVTRYTNEEQEAESSNETQTPEDAQGGEAGNNEEGNTETVRVAKRRSNSAAAIMGKYRQVTVGIESMTQEAKDRMSEFGWPEERMTVLAGMGQEYENLCRIAEDKQTELRTVSAELDRRYRIAQDWYRNVSQTARDLALIHDHLAPELKLMGEALIAA